MDENLNKQYLGRLDPDQYMLAKDSSVARYLVDLGLTDTRSKNLADAIQDLFSALCEVDERYHDLLMREAPEIFLCAQIYADVNGSPNKSWRHKIQKSFDAWIQSDYGLNKLYHGRNNQEEK